MALDTVVVGPNRTRLIRQLADMSAVTGETLPEPADLRLGRLLDLSSSIRIAAAQLAGTEADFSPSGPAPQVVRDDYLAVRATLLKAVEASFNPGPGYTRLKLPRFEDMPEGDEQALLGACQRFYASQQREIVFRIAGLRERVSYAVAQQSPGLSQLVALDATLGDALSALGTRCFEAIPALLGRRFTRLRLFPALDSGAASYDKFCREMKALLLAEIDARLLPILGLVEALDDHLTAENHD
jgi:hypothetical protein